MVRLFVLAVIGSFVALSTHAQTAIKRPIRSIVASPPGGPSDVQMRLFAPKMGEALGQTIVVDNRPSNKDRKSTRLNSSHVSESRMPSSA